MNSAARKTGSGDPQWGAARPLDWFRRWAFIAVLALVDTLWLWTKGVGVASGPIWHQLMIAGVGILIGIACLAASSLARKFATKIRITLVFRAVADFAWTLSQLMIYILPAVALEYLAASIDRPLADAAFARADALLGFDWAAFASWTNSQATLRAVLLWVYFSVVWQTGLVMLQGSATKVGDTNGEFVWNVMISGSICTIIFALVPALGNEGLAEHGPMAALLQTRDPTWRQLNLDDAQGLITFPSFHTALGIIFPYVVRRSRWLFWLLALFNAVMILSTIPVGGHYLVDIIAGALVAGASIGITRLIRQPRNVRI